MDTCTTIMALPPQDPLCPSHCAVIDAGWLMYMVSTHTPQHTHTHTEHSTGCLLQPLAQLSQPAQEKLDLLPFLVDLPQFVGGRGGDLFSSA